MATTTDYLTQLQRDKQTLVDNLVSKGVSATSDETFTSLVPKVAEITSGGSESIDEYIVTGSSSSNAIINRIVKLPMIDLSGNYSANKLCYGLVSITEIPEWDTSTVSKFRETFYGCTNLNKIPLLDFSKANDISNLLYGCTKVTILGGFKDLGKEYSASNSANHANLKLDLSPCTLLTHESLMNVINNLYDIKTKGCQVQSLVLGSTNLAKLTEEEIAIATNKGWAVS